jgi:hypothetical protein
VKTKNTPARFPRRGGTLLTPELVTPARYLSIEALRALLVEWQALLGLQGWVIEVTLVSAGAFSGSNVLGDCDTGSGTKRRAFLRILDAADYGSDPALDDHETVLVHELLHLVMPTSLFAGKVAYQDLRYRLYEQGIDQLARTLVALKRAERC